MRWNSPSGDIKLSDEITRFKMLINYWFSDNQMYLYGLQPVAVFFECSFYYCVLACMLLNSTNFEKKLNSCLWMLLQSYNQSILVNPLSNIYTTSNIYPISNISPTSDINPTSDIYPTSNINPVSYHFF